jgi:hypothetical protein
MIDAFQGAVSLAAAATIANAIGPRVARELISREASYQAAA